MSFLAVGLKSVKTMQLSLFFWGFGATLWIALRDLSAPSPPPHLQHLLIFSITQATVKERHACPVFPHQEHHLLIAPLGEFRGKSHQRVDRVRLEGGKRRVSREESQTSDNTRKALKTRVLSLATQKQSVSASETK